MEKPPFFFFYFTLFFLFPQAKQRLQLCVCRRIIV